tara:strand:+ start:1096 stop:1308 length:213 start_codon:yes stop_codon:yes gene_type:complete
MGKLWDLWQEYENSVQMEQINQQAQQTSSLEERVYALEETLASTTTLLKEIVINVETKLNQDIDGDGQIG